MKKLDLGQTIGILANVGVIAGIVFLGVELQQNNQLLRAEAIGALLETRMYATEEYVRNDSLRAITIKNFSSEPLTDDEHTVLTAYYSRTLIGYQKDYFLFQEGILTEDYMVTNLPLIKRSFSATRDATVSRQDHWENFWRDIAPPDYREFIEQCVISDCETVPR